MLASLINGEDKASLPISDRSVLYGDALFETIAVNNGAPLLLNEHLTRLKQGVEQLGMLLDFSLLTSEIKQFLEVNAGQIGSPKVLRVTITRGSSGRGYAPAKDSEATRILSLHEWPENLESLRKGGVKLSISDITLSHQPQLAGLKHSNRLEQVLAAQRIPEGFDDVIMFDVNGHMVSTSKANLFFLFEGTWLTHDLSACGISGVMRNTLGDALYNRAIKGLASADSPVAYAQLSLEDIADAEAVLISNSIIGVMPVSQISIGLDANAKNEAVEKKFEPSVEIALIYNHLKSIGACV